MLMHVSDGTSMEQLLGKAHRYMKAEGKQGRRKYLRYGKAARVSTPQPALLQAPLPEALKCPGPGHAPGPRHAAGGRQSVSVTPSAVQAPALANTASRMPSLVF
jgi:hypothetical protein